MTTFRRCDVCRKELMENQPCIIVNGQLLQISVNALTQSIGHYPIEHICGECLYSAFCCNTSGT